MGISLTRAVALIALLFGLGGLTWRAWEIGTTPSAQATVTAIESHEGECRRPSGRYERCTAYRLKVQFVPQGSAQPVTALLELGPEGGALSVGGMVTVWHEAGDPQQVSVPSLRRGWAAPLAALVIGLLLLLLSSKSWRRPSQSGSRLP